MKVSIRQLRSLIEARIAASASYMKKERVREQLQSMVSAAVASGDINDEAALKAYFDSVTLAMTALQSIPLEVWQKLAAQKKVK